MTSRLKKDTKLDEDIISLINQQGINRFIRCFNVCGSILILFEFLLMFYQILFRSDNPLKIAYIICYAVLLLTCSMIFAAFYFSKDKEITKRIKIIKACEVIFMVVIEIWALAITMIDTHNNGIMDLLVYISVLTLLPSIVFIHPCFGISLQVVLDLFVYFAIFTLNDERLSYLLVNFSTYAFIAIIIYFLSYNIQRELYEREAELKRTSENDQLTGLLNRFSYANYIQMLKEHPENRQFAILLLDLNGLKLTNDTKGHSYGDELIQGAAWCIRKAFHKNGVCFRTGGDEFVVILNKRLTEIQPMLRTFESLCRNWKGNLISSPSVSFGLAEALEETDLDVNQLVELADKRMYSMKQEYYNKKETNRRKS